MVTINKTYNRFTKTKRKELKYSTKENHIKLQKDKQKEERKKGELQKSTGKQGK